MVPSSCLFAVVSGAASLWQTNCRLSVPTLPKNDYMLPVTQSIGSFIAAIQVWHVNKMELHEMKQTFCHFWRCNHLCHIVAACDCDMLLRPDANQCIGKSSLVMALSMMLKDINGRRGSAYFGICHSDRAVHKLWKQ